MHGGLEMPSCPHLRPVRGTLVPRFLLSSFLRLAMPVINICSVSCVSFVSFIHFWGSFWVFLDQIYAQTDNTDNTDILFFCFALSALSRPKVQIVQIVQCIFFERCVQKLSVSCSYIFLVIVNHYRYHHESIPFQMTINQQTLRRRCAESEG